MNNEKLAAQELGRIIIIKGCPEEESQDIFLLDASRNEVRQLLEKEDFTDSITDFIVAEASAEYLFQRTDTIVGIFYEYHDGMTEKPWNDSGSYFVMIERYRRDEGFNWYISKAKKNMEAESIVMNFSDFSEFWN
ncbi:MAG: hypothetical protein LBI40_00050 [Treponema sp.]|jgi:hypothetical protein|nr:hypothetical protein [Treponema sp.]